MSSESVILKASWQADAILFFPLFPLLLFSALLTLFFFETHFPIYFTVFFAFITFFFIIACSSIFIRIFTIAGNVALEKEGVRRFYAFGRDNFMPWSAIDSFAIWYLSIGDRIVFKRTDKDIYRIFSDAVYPISTPDLVKLLQNRLEHAKTGASLIDYASFKERPWWRAPKVNLTVFSGLFLWLLLLLFVKLIFFQTADFILQNDSSETIKDISVYAKTREGIKQFSLEGLAPHETRPTTLHGFMAGPIMLNYQKQNIPVCNIVKKQQCSWKGDVLVFSKEGLSHLIPIEKKGDCKPGKVSITSCPDNTGLK